MTFCSFWHKNYFQKFNFLYYCMQVIPTGNIRAVFVLAAFLESVQGSRVGRNVHPHEAQIYKNSHPTEMDPKGRICITKLRKFVFFYQFFHCIVQLFYGLFTKAFFQIHWVIFMEKKRNLLYSQRILIAIEKVLRNENYHKIFREKEIACGLNFFFALKCIGLSVTDTNDNFISAKKLIQK